MRRHRNRFPLRAVARSVARPAPSAALPEWVQPQLTELIDAAPDGDQWLPRNQI